MKYALIPLIMAVYLIILALSGCTRYSEGTYRTTTRIDNPLVETIKALKGTQGGPVQYSSQTDANMGAWQ